MDKRKQSVSSQLSIYTYSYLYSAADFLLEQAEKSDDGSFYNCMSSIVLSAFCIEAYLNHIGSEKLPFWDEDVKRGLSIKNKLKIICYHLNIDPDYSKRPFQSLKEIIKYRNLMAHAITEKITSQGVQTLIDGERVRYPQAWWVKHTNIKTTKRWLNDAESMIKEIHEATNSDMPALGILSFGSHVGKLIN